VKERLVKFYYSEATVNVAQASTGAAFTVNGPQVAVLGLVPVPQFAVAFTVYVVAIGLPQSNAGVVCAQLTPSVRTPVPQ